MFSRVRARGRGVETLPESVHDGGGSLLATLGSGYARGRSKLGETNGDRSFSARHKNQAYRAGSDDRKRPPRSGPTETGKLARSRLRAADRYKQSVLAGAAPNSMRNRPEACRVSDSWVARDEHARGCAPECPASPVRCRARTGDAEVCKPERFHADDAQPHLACSPCTRARRTHGARGARQRARWSLLRVGSCQIDALVRTRYREAALCATFS